MQGHLIVMVFQQAITTLPTASRPYWPALPAIWVYSPASSVLCADHCRCTASWSTARLVQDSKAYSLCWCQMVSCLRMI